MVPIYIFVAFVALGVVNPEGMKAWDFLAAKKEVARVRFGTIPEKLTRKSLVSVLVVKKYEGGILSWIRRFLAA